MNSCAWFQISAFHPPQCFPRLPRLILPAFWLRLTQRRDEHSAAEPQPKGQKKDRIMAGQNHAEQR